MIAAVWRQRRAWAIETRLMDAAIADQSSSADGDELARITAAFTALADQPQLALVQRYETRLHHMFQRGLHNLCLLRAVSNAAVRNEPNPISEHPDIEIALCPPEDGNEPA